VISTEDPVLLTIVGTSKIAGTDVVHTAIPAEDRMQAFLWRQLVPARTLFAKVFDPGFQPPRKRPLPERPVAPAPLSLTNQVDATNGMERSLTASNSVSITNSAMLATNSPAPTNKVAKPKFTKKQVEGRLKEIKRLYEEELLTPTFYNEKIDECEAAE
jgi:hypothetical protein